MVEMIDKVLWRVRYAVETSRVSGNNGAEDSIRFVVLGFLSNGIA